MHLLPLPLGIRVMIRHHLLVPLLLWPPPLRLATLSLPYLWVAPATVTIRRLMGGGGAAVGRKSFGLTDDFSASSPASPNFSTRGGDDVSAGHGDDFDDDMPTDSEASKYCFLDRLEHYMER